MTETLAPTSCIRVGDRVLVIDGEFKGKTATLLRQFTGARCQIAVEIGPGLRFPHTLYTRQIEKRRA